MPPESIMALHDGRSVFVHPNVPAVEPFVQGAALSIVPLRIGGGTRLKILESLALGTPVVSTTVGAEGLDLQAGEHLLLADTAEAFADAVIHFLNEPAYRHQIAMAGQHQTRQLYLWSAIRDRAATFVEGWLAARKSRAA
jgi:glycosyltransferase involved in cell wall biosynthesis